MVTNTKTSENNNTDNALSQESLTQFYKTVREFSQTLAEPLEIEDYVVQSMPDVSPTKWHLAHTSWFFETFVLSKAILEYKSPNPQYAYLFNSYYVLAGERHLRPKRGLISRPTVEETYSYRNHVDESMLQFMESANKKEWKELSAVIEIGIHHEQQHQELILTDIKHVLSENPLNPRYVSKQKPGRTTDKPQELKWVSFEGGVCNIGNEGEGFGYDNEYPSHKVYVNPYMLGSRLVTNAQYLEFIKDGGYETPEIWLSEGWATVETNDWKAPLYWQKINGEWMQFTLTGLRKVEPNEPLTHVTYFEADAYARWAGSRLPTEAEWEVAASNLEIEGNFVDNMNFHPAPLNKSSNGQPLKQMFGDVWEWTQSAYSAYPGYKTPPGALGEYNGKFMCNQMVLRGGSCATSKSHIRKTYRNFFPTDARWQFMGIRLAKDED
ncbi:MAG: ergothioneine biosynthesis protein EgtB [Deltaproteobacteria bacterium]|nr:ergothioneine biosynthesis protein EgtB [Deltaproteobacteria bacterium]